MRGRSILLVEDEPLVARMLMGAFEIWGYTAYHASNASEALELAAEHYDTISLVICDVMLPEMHGTQVAARIREMYPRVKTCFTSGYTLDILSKEGLLNQEDLNSSVTFLQKPFLPTVLHELIRRSMKETPSARPAARAGKAYAAAAY